MYDYLAQEPAGMLVRPHVPTGWTPKLAKPKRKAKKFDENNPMSKSRQQLEARIRTSLLRRFVSRCLHILRF